MQSHLSLGSSGKGPAKEAPQSPVVLRSAPVSQEGVDIIKGLHRRVGWASRPQARHAAQQQNGWLQDGYLQRPSQPITKKQVGNMVLHLTSLLLHAIASRLFDCTCMAVLSGKLCSHVWHPRTQERPYQ